MPGNIIAVFSIILLAVNCSASKDSNSPWESFELFSSNYRYVACIRENPADSSKNYWEKKYILHVFRRKGNKKKLVWKSPFEYTGYFGGILNNSGNIFCYIDYRDNHNTHIVLINQTKNELFTKSGNSLLIKNNNLLKKIRHSLRQHEGGSPYMSADHKMEISPFVIQIPTGETFIMNPLTGYIQN